jgi:hypothetical protein
MNRGHPARIEREAQQFVGLIKNQSASRRYADRMSELRQDSKNGSIHRNHTILLG